MDDFKSQLSAFLVENKVMGYTAGFCIALVTKDVIQSLITDIFIPVILILLSYIKIKSIINILPKSDGLNIIKFINYVVTWIIMIIATFIFIQQFMASLSSKDTSNNNVNNIINYQY
jgi:large-conductance mechanosensitive channel